MKKRIIIPSLITAVAMGGVALAGRCKVLPLEAAIHRKGLTASQAKPTDCGALPFESMGILNNEDSMMYATNSLTGKCTQPLYLLF